MKPTKAAVVTLPEPQAATAERLAASFKQLSVDLVRSGMHGPNLAVALRQAADAIEGAETRDSPGVTTLGPVSNPTLDAINDADVRSFNVGHLESDPRIAALVITVASAKEFGFTLSIADLRVMGETLIRRAGDLARLAVKKESGR
jgi:hypothetical protein